MATLGYGERSTPAACGTCMIALGPETLTGLVGRPSTWMISDCLVPFSVLQPVFQIPGSTPFLGLGVGGVGVEPPHRYALGKDGGSATRPGGQAAGGRCVNWTSFPIGGHHQKTDSTRLSPPPIHPSPLSALLNAVAPVLWALPETPLTSHPPTERLQN